MYSRSKAMGYLESFHAFCDGSWPRRTRDCRARRGQNIRDQTGTIDDETTFRQAHRRHHSPALTEIVGSPIPKVSRTSWHCRPTDHARPPSTASPGNRSPCPLTWHSPWGGFPARKRTRRRPCSQPSPSSCTAIRERRRSSSAFPRGSRKGADREVSRNRSRRLSRCGSTCRVIPDSAISRRVCAGSGTTPGRVEVLTSQGHRTTMPVGTSGEPPAVPGLVQLFVRRLDRPRMIECTGVWQPTGPHTSRNGVVLACHREGGKLDCALEYQCRIVRRGDGPPDAGALPGIASGSRGESRRADLDLAPVDRRRTPPIDRRVEPARLWRRLLLRRSSTMKPLRHRPRRLPTPSPLSSRSGS